jgi:predicted nucleotide-binding protein (sugar kinase/HSP70/actin superfamily)
MKVAFPYFGYDTIALKNFVENLGAEARLPSPPTERTISLGTKFSPELICLPFKITLGNLIESVEAGADTLLMAAGARKCRFGYYHYIQENILRKIGNGHSFYPISQYTPFEFFFTKMPKIFSVSPMKVISATYLLLQNSALIDHFHNLVRKARAIDFRKAADREKQALVILGNAKNILQVRKAKKSIERLFDFTEIVPHKIIKVGLVGEIYLMLEPFANHDIEKELGKMGVWVWNKRSLYRHLKHLLHIDHLGIKYRFEASHYLKESPGGEAINTVGEARSFIKGGADGIIHIYPFTCMPENIAFEALQKMSADYSIPVLSLSIDEHTSKTGLLTRLEAFIDILKRAESKRVVNKTHLSSPLTAH